MEIIEKFVEFNKYCKTCKYERLEDSKDPCCECLGKPVNLYSTKPVNWEAKEE